MRGTATPRHSPSARKSAAYEVARRLIDLCLAAVLLLLTAPLLLVAGAAILLTTRQNPLFAQTRLGRNGRPFDMYKLRTMRDSASAPPPVAKRPDDPRVTFVGRFLRRTSLDELPQLLNVLRGEMSVVGPRPALPIEVAVYPCCWRRAFDVAPGITGLWQVSGRSTLTARQRAVLDRYYVRKRSWRLDLTILLRTVGATLGMRGAW